MLQIESLSFFYKKNVLSNAHLSLSSNEKLVLLGFNGAGKTTLLKLLAGQLGWQKGKVFWQGQLVAPWRLRTNFWRQHIGFAPQSLSFIPAWSVEEYLQYAAALLGLRQQQHHLAWLLKIFDLKPVAKTLCTKLSTGTFKRLLLAQACLTKPPLLLLDEPTAGLDFKQRQQLFDLLTVFFAESAVILTTHDLSEASTFGQRRLFLQQGQLLPMPNLDFALPYYQLAWHRPPNLSQLQTLLPDLPWSEWAWQILPNPSILPLNAYHLSIMQKYAEAWALWQLMPLEAKDVAVMLAEWIKAREDR